MKYNNGETVYVKDKRGLIEATVVHYNEAGYYLMFIHSEPLDKYRGHVFDDHELISQKEMDYKKDFQKLLK